MVLKTSGMGDILRRALGKATVKIAFVFGSLSNNREGAESDVDLMVIGSVGLRVLSGWLSGITEQIGREINPHVMSVKEYRRRKRSGDHFLNVVLESKKIFIKGSEDELAELGR